MSNPSAAPWVLLFSVNDYDQHGEYFITVFATKPALAQLSGLITPLTSPNGYAKVTLAGLQRLWNGDGEDFRRPGATSLGGENTYHLRQVPWSWSPPAPRAATAQAVGEAQS